MIISFTLLRSLKVNSKVTHRKFITHAPVVWLVASLAIYFLAHDPFYEYFGLTVLVASWSHFVFDSIEFGVMWLWPFSTRQYALFSWTDDDRYLNEPLLSFYRKYFMNVYLKMKTSWLEVAVCMTALAVFLFGN